MRKIFLMAGLALSLVAGAADKAPVSWREPLTGMEFVQIPKGCFQMGNQKAVVFRDMPPALPFSEQDMSFNDELPQHEACVDAFWMGRYEVRTEEWQRVMGGTASRPGTPVAKVSWEQATTFAQRLTERAGGKYKFRLPTEAEWEYACRAGATTEIVPELGDVAERAWYGVEPDGLRKQTQPVGKLAPNAFGLYDMLGNVWEWVQDSYQANAYASHALYNPLVQASGADKVIRGASYRSQPLHVRCARRSHYDAADSLGTIGLRLVRTP